MMVRPNAVGRSLLTTIQRRRLSARSCSSAAAVDDTTNPPPTITTHSSSKQYTPIYIAATKQHVGKTSVSLALMSGLSKRGRVGFIKPVGQHSVTVTDPVHNQPITIDKDAALMKAHFGLEHVDYQDTSPVLIPKGYTRDYLDGSVTQQEQFQRIVSSFGRIQQSSDMVLCEGTGHTAVGSIVDASNADTAALLKAHMVLVANGGLGSSFDELHLNWNFCQQKNVPIAGVIINKVQPDKYEQTQHYLKKAISQKWGDDIPVLGCIPDRPFLGSPALADMERLLDATLVSGLDHRLRHYRVQDVTLVATSLEVFLRTLRKNRMTGNRKLFVCHASRNDILLGYLMGSIDRVYRRESHKHSSTTATYDPTAAATTVEEEENWETAMIVTGCAEFPISTQVLEIVTSLPDYAPPVLMTNQPTDDVMAGIYGYTPKLNIEDNNRVETAIQHYEPYIDFDTLLERVQVEPLDAQTQVVQ